VLFVLQLQDLAASPAIRDPKLNTAKCIIQGHELKISAKGHHIRTILYCSLGFVMLSGFLLSKCVLALQDDGDRKTPKEKNTAKAIYILCCVLSVLGIILLITTLGLSSSYLYRHKEKASPDIIIIVTIIIVYSFVLYIYLRCFFIVMSANVTSYLFCWLMTGIMINPTWGLTVALLVCSIFAALVYVVYLYLDTTDEDPSSDKQHTILFCVFSFLAVLLLVVIVLFAGQSYNSKETADDVLKTILLYFIGAFISWISWKKHPLHPGTAQNAPTGTAQNAPTGTAQNAPTGTAQNAPTGTAQNAPTGTAQNGPSSAGTVENGSKAQNTSFPVSSRSSSKGKSYTNNHEMQHLIETKGNEI